MEKLLAVTVNWQFVLVCIVWISLFCLGEVSSDGVLSIRFLRYRNPGGEGNNGHCCDGKWSMCTSRCDHQFTVCLDATGREGNMDSCLYGRAITEKIKNEDENVFGNKFADLKNPLVFKITGSINIMAALKVNVMDVDEGLFNYADFVDYLSADIYVHKGPFTEVNMPITMHSRTILETHITVRCDTDWYDEDCTVYCKPSKEDNYYCDGWTGEKICHPGWAGVNCDIVDDF